MLFTRIIARRFTDYSNNKSLGVRLRIKRLRPLLAMIETVFLQEGFVNLIDIGGTEQYWNMLPTQYLSDRNVKVTLVNLPQPKMPMAHGPFQFAGADGCDLAEFNDKSFHIAHSNSVIEHVGDCERMAKFAKELSRVSNAYFVQTPNYWFPIEPHCMMPFFHWLPKSFRIWLVLHFQLGHWRQATSITDAEYIVNSARLLSKKQLQSLFPDAYIITERFMGMQKSNIAVKR